MKRILTSLLLLLLLCAMAVPALAESGRTEALVVDYAGLLSAAERTELENLAETTGKACRCDIVIWTVENTADMFVEEYTESVYHGLGYGWDQEKSGVILLISMEDRSYDLYTYGRCDYLPYKHWSGVESDVVSYLSNNDWYGAFHCFIRESESVIQRDQKFFNSDGTGVFFTITTDKVVTALIVGFFPALITASLLKKKMKSAVLQTRADRYAGEVVLAQQDDRYVRTDVVRVRHESSGSSGGGGSHHSGGGGGSHHSGHF